MTDTNRVDMVFLDIDGTIYFKGEIVESAARAVKMLIDKEFPVALCTGRSVLHARHIQQALQVPYGIYFNGGLVQSAEEALYSAPFEFQDARNIVDFASENGIATIVHTMHRSLALPGIPEKYESILAQFDFPDIEIVDRQEELFADEIVFQINGFMTKDWDQEFEQRFPASYIYRWNDEACDFQRRKSDKSIGALHLLKHLGINPAHAVHFGDGHNDLGMFRELGLSVAMGNASDDVKRLAKHTTTSADEDGVALGLSELGLL